MYQEHTCHLKVSAIWSFKKSRPFWKWSIVRVRLCIVPVSYQDVWCLGCRVAKSTRKLRLRESMVSFGSASPRAHISNTSFITQRRLLRPPTWRIWRIVALNPLGYSRMCRCNHLLRIPKVVGRTNSDIHRFKKKFEPIDTIPVDIATKKLIHGFKWALYEREWEIISVVIVTTFLFCSIDSK